MIGNTRQTSITTKEIMQTVKLGDKFHYLYPDPSEKSVGKGTKKIKALVKVTKLFPNLVEVREIETNKKMYLSCADLLLDTDIKSLLPFRKTGTSKKTHKYFSILEEEGQDDWY